MTLQRWSKKKKKSNNRGKWYSAAEAGSGSEHVGGASADCWCQNVKRKLKWKKRREGRKWGRENGWTSLERGKWSSAEAFIVPEVQWLCSFYSYKQNLYRDIKPKHRPPSLLLLLLLLLLFTSAANILKTKHCSHSSVGLLLLLLLLLKIRLCLICAIIWTWYKCSNIVSMGGDYLFYILHVTAGSQPGENTTAEASKRSVE